MLIAVEERESEPCIRVNLTIILKPNLASQALNVRSIKLIWCIGEFMLWRLKGTNKTMVNIIPSKHNNDIRRWSKLIINEIIMIIKDVKISSK